MDYNQFIAKEQRYSRPQFKQMPPSTERIHRNDLNPRFDHHHRLSEPKNRVNLIKINKNKLPGDFFLKKEAQSRRNLAHKFHLQQEMPESYNIHKKAQSEQLHYSPQKTSFFGFFEEQQSVQSNNNKNNSNSKLYNRKFETRDDAKRDVFPIESTRKLTTAMKNGKNDLLQLFPSTHEDHLSEIIVSSSKTKNLKLSPRKQISSRLREPQNIIDPEKIISQLSQREVRKAAPPKSSNISMSEPIRQNQSLNITFFNAKSTCFPPINRPSQIS